MKILRLLLFPLALLYGAIVKTRNALYSSGFLNAAEFDVPIINVGNIAMKGTGKTPMIEYLIELLAGNYNVGVISKGLKRKTSGFRVVSAQDNYHKIGDEPRQVYAKYGQHIKLAVGENRALAIPSLIQKYPAIELLLLDDAFQYLAVKPAMNILLTTYQNPFWKDQLFPVGWLQEPKKRAKEADIIVVTRCPETLSEDEKRAFARDFDFGKNQYLFFSSIKYLAPYNAFGGGERWQFTGNEEILLFTGIAEEKPLIEYLDPLSKEVHWLNFSDHFTYGRRDVEQIISAYKNMGEVNKLLLTTERDAVKFEPFAKLLRENKIDLYCIPIKIVFLQNDGRNLNNLIFDFLEYYFKTEQ